MPYIAFGFDDAGAGFDQSPFASDINVQIGAVGVSPAAVGLANVRSPERHEVSAQSVSPDSVGIAQVHVLSPVREQVVDLGAWGSGGFTGAILIEPDLIVGRAAAYLRQIDWASGTGVSLLLASTDTGQPHTAGPEFIPDVEDYSLAFTFADSNGGSVVIGGPNDPDSTSQDPTEPYYWLPSNNFEWLTWYNNAANNGYDVILTIRAVPPPVPPRLDLSAFADSPLATALSAVQVQLTGRRAVGALVSPPTATGIATLYIESIARHAVTAAVTLGAFLSSLTVNTRVPVRHAVTASRGSGAVTYTAAALRTDLLQLADFPNPNLDFDWLALLERSTSAPDLYLGVPRNGFDTPLDGEVGMSADEEPITRIRLPSNTTLLLNDSGALVLNDYFTGDGADLTLYVVNDQLEVMSRTVTRISGGLNFFNLSIPAEMGQFITNIAVGERYLFAGARASRGANYGVEASYTVAGATTTAAVLRRVPDRNVVAASLNVPTPAYAVSVQVREPTRHAVQAAYTVAGLSATAAVQLRVVIMHMVAGSTTFAASTATATVINRNAARFPVTAGTTFASLTGSATLQVQGTVQHPVEASRLLSAAITTVSVQRREPLRRAVEATRNHNPFVGGIVNVNVRAPDRYAVLASIIRKPITSTAQVGRRVPARVQIFAAGPFPVFTSTATVQRRLFLVTAAVTLPGISATASVQTRVPDRHPVTAAYTVGEATGTTTAQKRLSDRIAVTAAVTLPAATSTAAVYRRLPVTATSTFGAVTAAAIVQGRTSTRHSVTAEATYSAATGTVAVALRTVPRYVVRAAAGAAAASFGSSVQVRATDRHAVIADAAYGGVTSALTVEKRLADRLPVTAGVTYAGLSAMGAIDKRLPVTAEVTYAAFTASLDVELERRARHPVTAGATYATAITYTGAVQKRLSARRSVQASVTYAGMAATAPVYRRLPVTATSTYAAFTSALTVQTQGATRHDVRAGILYTRLVAIVSVTLRGAVRKVCTGQCHPTRSQCVGHSGPAHTHAEGCGRQCHPQCRCLYRTSADPQDYPPCRNAQCRHARGCRVYGRDTVTDSPQHGGDGGCHLCCLCVHGHRISAYGPANCGAGQYHLRCIYYILASHERSCHAARPSYECPPDPVGFHHPAHRLEPTRRRYRYAVAIRVSGGRRRVAGHHERQHRI